MSETRNPFAASDKQNSAGSKGTLIAWGLAAVGLLGAAGGFYLWNQAKTAHHSELGTLQAKMERTATDLGHAILLNQTNQELILTLTNRISALEAEKANLQKEKDQVGQTARSLEDEMRQQLESRDVTISKLQGKLTVTIVDRVMFDSGEAILKPDGAAVMQKIADLLTSHPELKIHVIGHTDNVPIRQTAQSRFASNWELSAARALAAVHFLTEKAGVDPHRLGAVGYGEFRPIADNSTPEGRARNRRIAITILPDELVAGDVIPMAKAQAATNAVPEIPGEAPK